MGCQHLLLCLVWPVWNGGGMLGKLAMSSRLLSRICNIRNSMFRLCCHCIFAHLFETKFHSYYEVRYNLLGQGSVHTDRLTIPVIAKNGYSTFLSLTLSLRGQCERILSHKKLKTFVEMQSSCKILSTVYMYQIPSRTCKRLHWLY